MITLSKFFRAMRFMTSTVMIFVLVLSALTCAASDANAKTKKKSHHKSHSAPYSPPNAYILIDAYTGRVISQNDADRSLYPASLTKLMTILLTFDALESGKISLKSSVPMTSHAASMPPSKLGLRPGQSLTVEQAIKALVTKSANDVAVALGERLGGSESRFAQMMNLKARELGMNHTHFVNACGLHNVNQKSSARDMAKLAMHIIRTYPGRYSVFSLSNFYFNGKNYRNHNRLMESYRGMDGMKTGYIGPSGFNLVASAKRGNTRLIGVVFGGSTANSRNAQMANLLDKGFDVMRQTTTASIPPAPPPPPVSAVPAAPPAPSTHATQGKKPILNLTPLSSTSPPSIAPPPAPPSIEFTSRVAANPSNPVAATMPLSPPTPIVKLGEGWAVQVGAFQDRASTDQAIYKAIQRLPAPLNRGTPLIIPLRTSEATWIFRARIGGYTKEQAMQACRYLDNCLTISPSAN